MSLHNKILDAIEQKIESQLLPDVKGDYMKIVVAGMKVAQNKGPNGILSGLKNRPDPIGDCAVGAVNLVVMMSKTSKGVMPIKAMWPAAMDLMLHALDLVEMAGIAKIDNAAVEHATHVFTNRMMQAYKITPQMLNNAATHVHGIMQDPTKMELINRKAGVVKSPGASEPTTLPAGPTSAASA